MKDISSMLEMFQSYMDGLDIPSDPAGLYAPVRYALSLGGKRMRPLLLMLAYNIYGDDIEKTFDAACGIEIFHNFTLLHDDVMDKADMRRGKPTVHRKWNENTAILSGDGMVLLAYRYLNRIPSAYRERVIQIADKAFLEVAEGQQYDMEFEQRTDVTESEYMEMIRLKTSVLPAAALEIGAVLGDALQKDSESLYGFGEKMGLAFQLQDDWLDVYGNPDVFGKRIGGDILCNKKTYLYIKARELADVSQNLEKKLRLCEQVEALKESTEWKATAEKIAGLRQEWKELGPVAKKYSASIWKRFNDACDVFFENRNNTLSSQRTEEAANLKAKKEILEKLSAYDPSSLTEDDIQNIQNLISEWNATGHVPFKHKDNIIKEFRRICDILSSTVSLRDTGRRAGQRRQGGSETPFEKLSRQYETLKNEIQTYENNLGFLSASSKSGGKLVDSIQEKINKLKEEAADLLSQIKSFKTDESEE